MLLSAGTSALIIVAIVAALHPGCSLWLVRSLRGALDRLERYALAALVRRSSSASEKWFGGLQQRLTSAATNTVDADALTYAGATIYQSTHTLQLPYLPIADDTEGIAGLEDVAHIVQLIRPSGHRCLVLNLGGGAFDGPATWLSERTGCTVHTADPFRRDAAHNEAVQSAVEAAGGADVVASISVLNVIAEQTNRLAHISLARRALRPGGAACFKVWGGCWPERGTGAAADDTERGTHQMHAWASAFEAEVGAVFGADAVYVDNVRSMLVAVRAAAA